MLDIAGVSLRTDANRRIFGLSPATAGFALVAFLVTAAILWLQITLRVGRYESDSLPIFPRLFLFEDYPASYLVICAILLSAVPDAQKWAAMLAGEMARHPLVTAIISTAAFAAGSLWVYHAHPLSMDEYAPYLQSKIFAAGALTGRFPPELIDRLIETPFQNYFIHVSRTDGRIASSYWPGFALLLTPFMAAGVPWLCNPVLSGASVWVIHRLTLRLTQSVEAAGAAMLFAIGSAVLVINAMGFYSMPAHLLCNAIFVLLLLESSPLRTFFAGLVGGLALVLHNPVPHMLFAIPWLLWLATRRDRKPLLFAAMGYLPWIVIVGFGWNHMLRELAVGSVAAGTPGAGSSLVNALKLFVGVFKVPDETLLFDRLVALAKLWLWAAPLMMLLAGVGFWRQRGNPQIQLLLASLALTFIGYLFVPLDQGHGWGFRYIHSAWFVLPVLAGAAFAPVAGEGETVGARILPLANLTRAGALWGLALLVPCFAWQVHSFIGAHLAQTPTADHGKPRVVLIDGGAGYFARDLVQNDPFLRDPVVMMISRGVPADKQMMAQRFPDLVLLRADGRGSVWGYPDPR